MNKIKKLAYPFRVTPLHPQWFGYRHNHKVYADITRHASGLVLDVGCGSGFPKNILRSGCLYFGLDLPFTSTNWYNTRPDIYGTAEILPLQDSSVSTILLLDVLEHIKAPHKCLEELYRVLSPGGILIIKIPFLYPLHDAPLDFTRWTEYGLLQLFNDNHFQIIESRKFGQPLETAALLLCIAISKHTINWIGNKSIFSILGILLSATIPFINLGAWILCKISNKDPMMPHTYHFVLQKK